MMWKCQILMVSSSWSLLVSKWTFLSSVSRNPLHHVSFCTWYVFHFHWKSSISLSCWYSSYPTPYFMGDLFLTWRCKHPHIKGAKYKWRANGGGAAEGPKFKNLHKPKFWEKKMLDHRLSQKVKMLGTRPINAYQAIQQVMHMTN